MASIVEKTILNEVEKYFDGCVICTLFENDIILRYSNYQVKYNHDYTYSDIAFNFCVRLYYFGEIDIKKFNVYFINNLIKDIDKRCCIINSNINNYFHGKVSIKPDTSIILFKFQGFTSALETKYLYTYTLKEIAEDFCIQLYDYLTFNEPLLRDIF